MGTSAPLMSSQSYTPPYGMHGGWEGTECEWKEVRKEAGWVLEGTRALNTYPIPIDDIGCALTSSSSSVTPSRPLNAQKLATIGQLVLLLPRDARASRLMEENIPRTT